MPVWLYACAGATLASFGVAVWIFGLWPVLGTLAALWLWIAASVGAVAMWQEWSPLERDDLGVEYERDVIDDIRRERAKRTAQGVEQ